MRYPLYSEYLEPLKKVLGSGVLPKLSHFSGKAFHGTTEVEAENILQTGNWAQGLKTWTHSWMGPCVHFFENIQPHPYFQAEPIDDKNVGSLAAQCSAAKEFVLMRMKDAPVVIEADLDCPRILDLESEENDQFIHQLIGEFRKAARREGGDERRITDDTCYLGRILSHHRDQFSSDLRPDGFRLRYSCSVGMCWSIAIVDISVIPKNVSIRRFCLV